MKVKELLSNIATIVYLYNMESDKDENVCLHTRSKLEGYRECLSLFGYIFYYRHKKDLYYNNIAEIALYKDNECIFELEDLTQEKLERLMLKEGA